MIKISNETKLLEDYYNMVGKGHEADMIVSKGIYTRKTSVLVHGNSHDLIHTGHDLSVAI